MTAVAALAYGAVGLAGVCWGLAAVSVPAAGRWKAAAGIAIAELFAGAIVGMLVFAAGAAWIIASGAAYAPMGEIATIAGGLVAAAVGAGMAVAARRAARP